MAYKEPSTSTLSHTSTTSNKQAEWYAGNKVKGSTDDFVGHVTSDTLNTSLHYINGSGWLSVTIGDFDPTRTARSITIKATSENTTGSDRMCRVFLKNSKNVSNRFIQVTQKKSESTPTQINDDTTYYINFDNNNTNWLTDRFSHYGAAQLTSDTGYVVASSYDLEKFDSVLLSNVLNKCYTYFGTQRVDNNYAKLKVNVNTDGGLILSSYNDSNGYKCIDVLCPISSTSAEEIVQSTWVSKGKKYVGSVLYLYRILNTTGPIYAVAKYDDNIGTLSTYPDAPTTNVEIIYKY